MKLISSHSCAYPLVRFCHIAILNVLPVGIEYMHGVSAFLSAIYGLKGAVETFRKWLPSCNSFLRVARLLGCPFLYIGRGGKLFVTVSL